MKVAITGGEGFVGKHLVKLVQSKGIELSLFDHAKHDLFEPETLKDFLSGKDAVVHLAAVNKDDDFANIVRVNVLGTKGLLDAMLDFAPSAKLIFASSFQVYLKNSIYGASKKVAEELIADYSLKFGLRSIVLRITNMYGSGCKPFYNSALATFIYQIKRGLPIVINGNGTQRRDYLHVQDGCLAILKALQYEPKDALTKIDICTGKLTSLNQIIEILQKITGRKFTVSYRRSVKADDWDFGKDYTEAKKLLNWEHKITIEAGLAKVLKEDLR